MRLKGGLNWTPFCTSKTNIMVISVSSLYSFIVGQMLAKGRGIPLKGWFCPTLLAKRISRLCNILISNRVTKHYPLTS